MACQKERDLIDLAMSRGTPAGDRARDKLLHALIATQEAARGIAFSYRCSRAGHIAKADVQKIGDYIVIIRKRNLSAKEKSHVRRLLLYDPGIYQEITGGQIEMKLF